MTSADAAGIAASLAELRWAPRQRLEFIDFRLLWDGRVNRSDLCRRFEISPQQGSADIAAYDRLAPGNMRYDPVARAFMRSPTFSPVLVGGRSDRWLLQLKAVQTGVLKKEHTWFDWTPPVEVAEAQRARVSDGVLEAVLDAIRRRTSLRVLYHTTSGKPPAERTIAPHALGQGAGRFHARCWSEENRAFRDFNLNRMAAIAADDATGIDPMLDLEWQTRIDLILRANPALSDHERETVRMDHRMTGDELVVRTRIALVFYLFHEFNLEETSEGLPDNKRPLVLANRAEVERARAAAEDMAALAISSAANDGLR